MTEVSWFSALCDDDYEFLGQPDPMLASSWAHCRNIVLTAEKGGFDNILLPSGYQLGLDTTAFAAAIAALTHKIRLLMAIRIGESWPPQLARQIATLDQITGGRMTINIISSDLPGEKLASAPRYARTLEVMQILKTLLNGEPLNHQGEHYKIDVAPPRITTVSGKCPPLYFGGLSDDAREAAAQGCDVYLMWPDTMPAVREIISDMRARAAKHGRTLKFGYRAHVIVRETESEARASASRLLSKLDADTGDAIRAKSLDFTSPIADATHYYVKRKDDKSISSIKDLSGKTVGVQAGSALLARLPELGTMLEKDGGKLGKIVEYTSYPEAYQDLALGRVDYVVNTIINLKTLVAEKPVFEVGQAVSGKSFPAWAVAKDNKELLAFLNEFIAKEKASGRFAELQKKWFGEAFPDLPVAFEPEF